MEKISVIKNALILALDESGNCGFFNIIISNDKIKEIDYRCELKTDIDILKKYRGAEIIDAKNKLILPSFHNANRNSLYSFSSVFLENSNFSNLDDNLSLALLDKYFSSPEAYNDLRSLFFLKSAVTSLNGEVLANETTSTLTRDFFGNISTGFCISNLDSCFTAYSVPVSNILTEQGKFHFIGIKDEENLNNYSLNSYRKMINEGAKKVLFELLKKAGSDEIVRKIFNKSFIKILIEHDLLSSDIAFSNPVYLHYDEINLLSERNVNIILCPSDLLNFSDKQLLVSDYLRQGINLCIGTGITGLSLLSELKSLKINLHKENISNESLLKTITINPARLFSYDRMSGTIEEGKYANLVFFNLDDIRSTVNIPEVDSERVSKHVIHSLSVKDITDVVYKGNFVVKHGNIRYMNYDVLKQQSAYLHKKIYEVGKYFELREKFLMRKRIKALSGREILEDELNTGNANNFGKNKQEITKQQFDPETRIFISPKDPSAFGFNNFIEDEDDYSICELENLDNGLNLLETDEDKVSKQKKNRMARIMIDDFEMEGIDFSQKSSTDKKIIIIDNVQQKPGDKTEIPSTNKKVIFKKDKLRFGFEDDK
ncbi:hypothetical protein D4R20_01030 [bacterium]|nr:MAG: hypothetical protein D4R20_01030 [bacterium]